MREAGSRGERPWRLAVAGLFLLGLGLAIGVFLSGSLRPCGDGSPTGDFLTGTGAPDADARARSAAILESRDVGALLDAGRRALEAQSYQRAMALFRRGLELDARQPAAHAYLGRILVHAGHADRARAAFDQALAIEPTLAPTPWGKGVVLDEAMGKTAAADEVWERLLAQDLSPADREQIRATLAQARSRMAGPGPTP